MKEFRKKVINLATVIALQESGRTGTDYSTCINNALDEACERLQVNRKEFIKLFL